MKYYCIGIKGTGMSALAQMLYDLGNEVVGYDDVKYYKFTEEGLRKRNITIYTDSTHELDPDMIVTYSKAFSLDHKEIQRVKKQGLKIIDYNELIGEVSKQFKTISVCGTHGKTTTSSLIKHVLYPTKGCNYFIGDGEGYANKNNSLFVLESCEYQKNFLSYYPTYAVLTNIELEHVECFDGLEDEIKTFETFVNKAEFIVACGDDENVRKIKTNKEIVYYGFDPSNDLYATNVELNDTGSQFDVYMNNAFYGHFEVPLFGRHMVLNTLACIAICHKEGITKDTIHDLLQTFVNAKRRFKEYTYGDIVIVDDYAHHPTELRVTLESARQKYPEKEVVGVFLPNTYSRTQALLDDFAEVLSKADKAYVMDISCDREKPEDYGNIRSDDLIKKIPGCEKISIESVDKLLKHKNAVICFMSCANIYLIIDAFKKLLGENNEK